MAKKQTWSERLAAAKATAAARHQGAAKSVTKATAGKTPRASKPMKLSFDPKVWAEDRVMLERAVKDTGKQMVTVLSELVDAVHEVTEELRQRTREHTLAAEAEEHTETVVEGAPEDDEGADDEDDAPIVQPKFREPTFRDELDDDDEGEHLADDDE